MKGNSVLMYGQFPPLITGEGIANEAVRAILLEEGCSVKIVDSCIIENVGDVGNVSFKKVYKAIIVMFSAIFQALRVGVLYATPGQTLFGIVRFLPVIYIALILKRRVYLHWHGYGLLPLIIKYPLLKNVLFREGINHILLTDNLKLSLETVGCSVSECVVVKNFSSEESVPPGKSCNEAKKLNVLFLGGLMIEKGILEFVEAAESTNKFEFTVCGRGGPEIMKRIKESEANNHLAFKGLVQGKEKADIYSTSDILVLQTFYPTEGVPLTIIEAMAHSCAVITTEHNGIPETVGQAALK